MRSRFRILEHLAEAEVFSRFEERNPTDSKALELRPANSNSRDSRGATASHSVHGGRQRGPNKARVGRFRADGGGSLTLE
jgi:hypothetical protein